MGFSGKQVSALRRRVDERFVRTREINGRELSYLEGWYAISAANRIFGFDGWSRETLDVKCVLARENRGTFVVVYTVKVRISVATDGAPIIREGHGTAEGRGNSPGEAHDVGLKAAETDATKRALITFGRPFGLELYRSDLSGRSRTAHDRQPTHVAPDRAPSVAQPDMPSLDDAKPHPDDGTPIPRPSTHYGLEKYLETREVRGALVRQAAQDILRIGHSPARPDGRASLRPAVQNGSELEQGGRDQHGIPRGPRNEFSNRRPLPASSVGRVSKRDEEPRETISQPAEIAAGTAHRSTVGSGNRIDKSLLPFGEPKRLRDKGHLKFVASQSCLVCGRSPCDPHHLRFAQPRAIGLKVSDEFTVPLCRTHHRNLHQAGDELRWWETFRVDPRPIARRLWEETHPPTTTSSPPRQGQPASEREDGAVRPDRDPVAEKDGTAVRNGLGDALNPSGGGDEGLATGKTLRHRKEAECHLQTPRAADGQ